MDSQISSVGIFANPANVPGEMGMVTRVENFDYPRRLAK
jgi:hypothetical protein